MALEVFVKPKPSETIFSMLSRAHMLSGCTTPLISLRNLTGHRGYKPLSSLPSNLRHICTALHLEQKPEIIVARHTLFNLYRPFLPIGRRDFVLQGMLESGSTKSRMGVLKSHCGGADQLAYCYQCVKDDTFKFGFPYWRREHVLVGVEFCHLHRLPLIKVDLANRKFGERCLQLPGDESSSPNWNSTQFERLCFVAEQVATISNTEFNTFINSQSYLKLLDERYLVTNSLHIRMKKLQKLVDDWLIPLANITPFDELISALRIERNWVANLVAGKEGMHHPLKHIALWGALDSDFKSLVEMSQVVQQMTLTLKAKEKSEITQDILQDALNKFRTATASARFLGRSVQTVLVLMEKFGLSPKRKPKKMNQIIMEKVLHLASVGCPSSKIALELNLSVSTVNRIKRSI